MYNDKKSLSPEELRAAAKKGDTASLLAGLGPKERELFTSLMQDKEARERLLSSPKVAELLKNFMNGG